MDNLPLCAGCGHETENETGLCVTCEEQIQQADTDWTKKEDE